MPTFFIRCIPPSTTAQGKRAARTATGIRFFKSSKQASDEATWEALLAPHQPAEPLLGPLELTIALYYPYLGKHTARKSESDRSDYIPNVSKPDLDNVAKALIDILVRLRYMVDDKQIYKLRLEKWHVPPGEVGIAFDLDGVK